MHIQAVFAATWLVWYVTWLAAVVWSGRTRVQMRSDIGGAYRIVASVGVMLMFWPSGLGRAGAALGDLGAFTRRLWSAPVWLGWVLYGVLLCAFAFCWWARLHLGRLWSGFVTLKEDHHIVDTGPYGIVRHPIYTGVMAAALATAAARASPAALVGAVLLILGFVWVARTEERFLRDQLGAQAYDAYSRRVPMLIPLGRRIRPARSA